MGYIILQQRVGIGQLRGIKMKKKILYLISCLILLTIFYFINQSRNILTLPDNIEDKNYSYKTESNLISISPQIKKTVENFLYQDKSESELSRRGRLSQYFSGNSPVYKYDLEIIDTNFDKSLATINKIGSSSSEGEYFSYYVDVNIVYYKNNNVVSNKDKTYIFTMSKLDNDKLVGYDIRVEE